jgi:hypothetical protein
VVDRRWFGHLDGRKDDALVSRTVTMLAVRTDGWSEAETWLNCPLCAVRPQSGPPWSQQARAPVPLNRAAGPPAIPPFPSTQGLSWYFSTGPDRP